MIAECGCGWRSDQPSPDGAAFAAATHRQACMGPGRRARLEDLHRRLDGQLAEIVDAVECGEFVTAGVVAGLVQDTVVELSEVALGQQGVLGR